MIIAVVPAFNEERNAKDSIEKLSYVMEHIAVVNDGSTDATLAILRELSKKIPLKLINHKRNLGQGKALISGFKYALKMNAEAVITFDADGQHDPSYIPHFLEIFQNGTDFIIGSRFLSSYEKAPLYRRMGIVFFSFLASLLTRRRITDLTSGYRLISCSLLKKMRFNQPQYSSPELYIQALMSGCKVKEIPIRMETRKYGQSNKGKVVYALGLFRSIVITYFQSILAN